MRARSRPSATTALLASLLAVACGAPADDAVTSGNAGGSYDDLVVLFEEFRVFHEPVVTDGVPDYTAAAMQRQYGELGEYQRRLAAFDIGEWPISQQVDYHLVRAEMNGLEFYHRVMKPWSTSPDFYWGSPSSKGSPFYGFSSSKVEPGFWFWLSARPDLPLRQDEIEAYRVRLRALPQILAQGKANIDLAEAKRDMALLGIRSMEREGMLLGELVPRLREHHPELVVHAEQALTAVQDYRDWINDNLDQMTAPTGVGKENFNWWARNVWLIPYTWDEAWALARREWDRNMAALKLEENGNRELPRLQPATDPAEYLRTYAEAEDELLRFLRERGFVDIAEAYARIGDVAIPASTEWMGRPMSFFTNLIARNPKMNIIHEDIGHGLDSIRQTGTQSPIRAARRLYELTHPRWEGFAGGLEEVLMHAGVYDEQPGRRARELQVIEYAYEGARAMGELQFIANAVDYAGWNQFEADMTPNGWAIADSNSMWNHKRDAVRAPGYQVAYPVGRSQFEKIIADRAHQLGDDFNMPDVIDEILAAGLVPFALAHWELTGLTDEVDKLW